MIEVTLTESELHAGAMTGVRRQIEAILKGLPDKHGFDGLGWDVHCEGAMGELALAKALGRYWGGTVNTFKTGGDVGKLQIRTRTKHHYDLLIRDDDRNEDVFILITGVSPTYRVHGWIVAGDAKREEWKQTYGNRPVAYFVPKEALNPINPEHQKAA